MSDKQEYQLEYVVKSSPKLLFNRISSPSGLSEWFADNVNSRGEKFTFFWDESEEIANLVSKKPNRHIRFKWESSEDDETYFEFRIEIDDLTEDVSLIITDFAEEDEMEEAKLLWDSQVQTLLSSLGS